MFAARDLHVVGDSTPYEVLQRGDLRSRPSKIDTLLGFNLNQVFNALVHESGPVISNGIDGI
jgi:hypothetical protein